MNRIDSTFAALKKKKQKALVLFMTGGDPSLAKTEALIPALEDSGVDLIEIGVPFSDPLADGPVIQEASQRALARGVTLEKILDMVARVRRRSRIPLVLMSYLNPILFLGLENFAKKAKAAGVDGVIVPDLPLEEAAETAASFKKHGLDLIHLLAPTSSPKRQLRIATASKGFVYFVSVTGVTGTRRTLPTETLHMVRSLKRRTRRPICVGFGVSTPEQAKKVASFGDGVIVGSAVVRALHQSKGSSPQAFCRKFVRPLAKALGKRV